MLYQQDAAKYRMADRMRAAERARLVNEARAASKQGGPEAGLNRLSIWGTLAAWAARASRQLMPRGRRSRVGSEAFARIPVR